MNQIQVTKDHYNFSEYVNIDRWCSYYYQIKEVLNSGCETLLIIGVGDNAVGRIISNYGISVHTFDFDENLKPTYVGDVSNIENIIKQKYDCVLCCQVLEHLPFENFEPILNQLSHIAIHKVIISLPVSRTEFQLFVRVLGHQKGLRWVIEKKWMKSFPFTGEHYWEVGIKDKGRKEIKKIYQKYFDIERDYLVPENSYHWFCILNCKNNI